MTLARRAADRPYAAVVPGAGTVTVLFTDLVGSTESLVALGEDRFDSVRDAHDALVGGTITANDGEVVKHTGDGYMAAFPRAADAVAAAAEIQRLVSKRNEDAEVALGVRIGISAGDVTERAGDYHGVPVIEAARLDDLLRADGVETLVFVGATTSVCVESTVRDAMFRDYHCLLVEDCMAEPIGAELPHSNHDASLLVLQFLFAWITDSATLLGALEKVVAHPA